jgi:peptide/nickel transport system substrate-binding protein
MPNFNKGGVGTYIDQKPYYFPGVIPMLVFNTTDKRLADPIVRRAIAMALDYNTIGQNAMSGYTAPYQASLMLPTPAEQALIDPAAIKQYQWPQDLTQAQAAANKLLDDNGWAKGADGIRAKGGVKLDNIKVECPTGWSDWQATCQVAAQAGKAIGIGMVTYFPNATVWTSDEQNCKFDIIMNSYGSADPASPWSRVYGAMCDTDIPPAGQANPIGDYGRYHNDKANALIAQIPVTTDPAKLKDLYTQLNVIYLQDMPAAGTMYRPAVFYEFNETVWTGFPKMNDGSGVPPCLCSDGWGIAGLYNLKLNK